MRMEDCNHNMGKTGKLSYRFVFGVFETVWTGVRSAQRNTYVLIRK